MKVAILGSGRMGEAVAGHLKGCESAPDVVAYDIADDRIRVMRDTFGLPGSTCLDDVLGDPAVKLVFVTAANHAHKELVIRSLEAGKAVLCEKPMANTIGDAREMVETAERLNVFFQVGFELRYSKVYMKIKEWIDAGLLGQVVNTHCLYCCSTYRKNAWRRTKQEGGDTFGERLSHYVDLPRWWIGSPVTEVFSACSPNVVPYVEVHDNYHTTYRFANGAVSHVTFYLNYPATFRGDPLADDITSLQLGDGHKLRYIVVGTKGAAENDLFYRRIKRWEFSDAPDVMASEWVESLTWDHTEDHFYYHNTTHQTEDVVRRVEKGLPPMTPARDAYETMRVCFAAEQSAETRRAVLLQDLP